MDGFAGFKSTAAEELSPAVKVVYPFHEVELGSEAPNQTQRRVQREHQGCKDGPLHKCRRTLMHGHYWTAGAFTA